jgi:hypothetical protein
MIKTTEFQGVTYNSEHGSPFDRGSADSWYSRPQLAHKMIHGPHGSRRVEAQDLTLQEMSDYYRGYEYNELHGGKKSWD